MNSVILDVKEDEQTNHPVNFLDMDWKGKLNIFICHTKIIQVLIYDVPDWAYPDIQ